MKAIRDYSDGQWLLLLWAFIVLFLFAGVGISTPVLVVAILAAIAAAYTTFLYVAERTGRSPTISVFGRQFGPKPPESGSPDAEPSSTETRGPENPELDHRESGSEGGTP